MVPSLFFKEFKTTVYLGDQAIDPFLRTRCCLGALGVAGIFPEDLVLPFQFVHPRAKHFAHPLVFTAFILLGGQTRYQVIALLDELRHVLA